eukprot:3466101-Pleurochrysis_carterae.AAC.1
MGPELKNRWREGRQRAVVKGFQRFSGMEGAVELPGERSGARESGAARRRRGDVCARGYVAIVYVRQADRYLKRRRHFLVLTNALVLLLAVLTSDRHALRH